MLPEGLGQSAAYFITVVGAAGALGTAAFGLVDATKVFGGGVANVGFGHLRRALDPFAPALVQAVGDDWPEFVQAHWRNGRSKAEQKAIATGLIQLGLTEQTARELAPLGHVDAERLQDAIAKLNRGEELDASEVNVIGRFRTSVEARMDAAFERAELQYRNFARFVAGIVATVLAGIGGGLIYADTPGGFSPDYFTSRQFGLALLVGAVAVPIAPLTKDLVSSLSAAARAVKLTKPS